MLEHSLPCWHCAGNVSPRALFCHGCGSIQPPGEVDPFTRLGVAAGFELDVASIERQLTGFARILAPARFQEKGERAQELASAQRAAREKAAAILRDPAARARALLELADAAPARPATGGQWEIAIAAAPDAGCRTRALTAVKDEMAAELRLLLDAFRLGDLALAATRLTRVEAMALAVEAARRLG
jgi:molecular chaperone HscB